MSTKIAAAVEKYNDFVSTVSDPRTNQWFMISSPVPLLILLVTYLYFSNVAGPRFMKHRKSYDLRYTLIVYNAVQVLFSLWLFYEGLQAGWLRDYSLRCQPVDYSNNGLRMASACWWYFTAKVIELLDTVFFVLRKKDNQVSFLHLYHHTMMPIAAWIGTKFLAGGHGTLLGLINSFVHVVMYSYYLLAGLGPQYQKYLWWKKYLTSMQMAQFVIVFIHCCQLFIFDCGYPRGIMVLVGLNALYFLYLFGTFYRRTYVQGNNKSKTKAS